MVNRTIPPANVTKPRPYAIAIRPQLSLLVAYHPPVSVYKYAHHTDGRLSTLW